jgi:aspartyl-tRNA(Asn)/glutamyl-tRNA(Gln) amidotransferase subunit A
VAIAHLRQAGFIILGRTQMTEFAFSGVGLNPHFEAPSSLWDRASQRVPGGSSSGAALSVADGMAYGAIGTDTGGSCRIPAAFNGVVGFKPTASRINKQGAFPLSPSLDSIGPLANSVACCAELDGVMSGHRPSLAASSLAGARIFIPRTMVFDGIDADVAAGFERVCALLRAQGALVHEMDVPEYQTIQQLNGKGGFAAAEAFHIHKAFIADKAQLYDPRVLSRIRRGQEQTAADYIALLEGRAAIISAYQQRLAGFDFCLYPTVPVIAPPKAAFASDEDYARLNLLLLRNPALINMLDGCAISIPVHQHGAPPQGAMLSAMGGQDAQLLNWALAVEEVLAPHRHS